MLSDRIYAKDSKGVLRFWQFETDGDKWRGISGQVGGAETASGWTTCTPKSQDTAEEQALFEALAEQKKKLDRKYRSTVEALDAGDVFTQPMLANNYDDIKGGVVFPAYAQPKLDGMRAIVSSEGAASRQGRPINTIPHVLVDLAPVFEWLAEQGYEDVEFDGEIYNHDFKDDFNTIMSVARKGFKLDKKALKAGVSEDAQRNALAERQREFIQYHIYDIIIPGMGFRDRIKLLQHIFQDVFEVPSVQLVQTVHVGCQELLDQLLEQWLTEGYEGQMVRTVLGFYEHTRSWHLLKRKDFETKEFKLLRIEAGNGNWAGLAKRVVFIIEDGRENEAGIRGNMARAKELLDNKAYYEAGDVTVRFMKQRTPDGKLRAPVAIDFHPEGRVD